MKRIFIALPISETLQKKALEFQKSHSSLPVRWLTGKNLHITIIPPWYENNITHTKKNLKQASRQTGPINIKFENITYGPNPYSPRLIWASGQTPQAIQNFKKILPQVGSRPFSLHLTLARFRQEDFKYPAVGGTTQKIVRPKDGHIEKISWEEVVTKFVLMQSHLSPSGADYEILEEFSL